VAIALDIKPGEAVAKLNTAEKAGKINRSLSADKIVHALTIGAPEAQMIQPAASDEVPDGEPNLGWPEFYEWAKATAWAPDPDRLELLRGNTMGFGKHQGRTYGDIIDNEHGYAAYLSTQCDNREVRETFVYLRAARKLAEESGQPELL
jgi:hypothetical protein